MRGNTDFTKGSLVGSLLVFSLPIMLSELFQSLYNSVDSLIVGNFLGTVSLAAVSVCSPISWLYVGFSTGMSVGTGVVVSKAYGHGNEEMLAKNAGTACSFSIVLGLFLSAVGVFAVPLLLRLVAVPKEVYPAAALYLRIYLAGVCCTIVYNIVTGILRAVGDARTPLYILFVTAFVNVMLDIALVKLVPMGVAGVALATVFSQLLSVLLAFRKIKRTVPGLSIRFSTLPAERGTIAEMMKIGLPSGMQNSITYLSNIFIWRYVSSFGTAVIAGVGVAQKINKLVDYPCKGFGMAMTTLTSQNAGAGRKDRIKKGAKSAMLLCGGIVLFLSLLLYLLAEPAARLFSSEAEVVTVCTDMLRLIAPFYVFMLVREIFSGVLRGNGISRQVMVLALSGMVAVRQIFLAVSLHFDHRATYIYACYPVAWFATALFITVYYILKRKMLLSEAAAEGMENA